MIEEYIHDLGNFPVKDLLPWEITSELENLIFELIQGLSNDYKINNGVAIHKSANIGHNVTIQAPAIICEGCFIGSNSYLRKGIFMAPGAKVGISCEIKSSIIMENSAIAHFNFVGDSIIGKNVNIEAGAILANHFNEREDKTIFIWHNDKRISTGVYKFGSLVGDKCKIGANAVLSPGTILKPATIVRRLELIEQDPE